MDCYGTLLASPGPGRYGRFRGECIILATPGPTASWKTRVVRRTTQRVVAYALVIDGDTDILLVRAGPLSVTPGRWYLPGGGIEFGESPAECAVRETREETGLSIRLGSLLMASSDVTTNASSACDTHTIRLIFEGFVVSGHLRHETDGTSNLAQWQPLPPAGLDVMPFVLDAIAVGR